MASSDSVGQQYWKRLLNILPSEVAYQWRNPGASPPRIGLELIFSKSPSIMADIPSDKITRFWLRTGIHPTDLEGIRREGKTFVLTVRAYDLFVWILENCQPIEVCGIKWNISVGSARVDPQYFESKLHQTYQSLKEEQWVKNFKLVQDNKPIADKDSNIIEMNTTRVYCWGEDFGEIPTLWDCGMTITSVACGDHHCVYLTDTGRVITSGDGFHGQLGSKQNIGPSQFLVPIPGQSRVTQIASGNNYSLCLTETRNVLYWGTCKFGIPTASGYGLKQVTLWKEESPTLYEALAKMQIIQIASGAAHMLFLTDDGDVWSVGAPDGGRLGRTGNPLEPGMITGTQKKRITKITCGYTNSIAISQSADYVYVWGRNDKMQCGVDTNGLPITTPLLLHSLSGKSVSKIVCGYSMYYALTAHGVYEWGNTNPMPNDYFLQNKVNVIDIGVGKTHAVALSNNGDVYTWGRSQLGQCGHGDCLTYDLPTKVYGLPQMSGVAAADHFCIALSGLLRIPHSADIEGCYNNPNSFPDMIIHIGNEEKTKKQTFAHRAIIAARCPKSYVLQLIAAGGDKSKMTHPPIIPNAPPPPNQFLDTPNVIVDLSFTSRGTLVTPISLECVLRYIYADIVIPISSDDVQAACELCDDFDVERLKTLLTTSAPAPPSTYLRDLSSLIPDPPNLVYESKSEKLEKEYKNSNPQLLAAFSDLTLSLLPSGQVFNVHRFLLSCRASYFTTLLTGNMMEASTRIVNFNTDETTCLWLLRFIYCDILCSTDINIVVELLKLSSMIQMDRLVFYCSRMIEKELDLETALYMYHLTLFHSIKGLNDICWQIMIKSWNAIEQTKYWKESLTTSEQAQFRNRYMLGQP